MRRSWIFRVRTRQELRLDLENLEPAQPHLWRSQRGAEDVPVPWPKRESRACSSSTLASGYGDQGPEPHRRMPADHGCDLTVVGVDRQFDTLRLAREATPAHQRMMFVQAGRAAPALPQPRQCGPGVLQPRTPPFRRTATRSVRAPRDEAASAASAPPASIWCAGVLPFFASGY